MPTDTVVDHPAPLETVVFDLGNVLVEWDRRLLYRQLISDPAELDEFLDTVLTLEVNADLDRGVPLGEVTGALADRHPDRRELIEAFRDRWAETLGPVLAGSVAILEELRARPLALLALSNWGHDTFAMAEERLPFLRHFDGVVISGREGVVKPDPKIFELLCARHGVVPETAVFIDDSPANIAAAARLGFHTVLFTSPDQCRRDLIALGLDLSPVTP
ncbi:MAG: HAD family phosphatase [Acidimicrobiales bacterium]